MRAELQGMPDVIRKTYFKSEWGEIMGVFGKGRELQFFMTDTDYKTFLEKIEGESIFFIRGYLFSTRKVDLFKRIPDEDWPTTTKSADWFIFNKALGKLVIEYDVNFEEYILRMGKSPVIQFSRSYKSKSHDVMVSGRISAMLSWKSPNSEDQLVETLQPEEFVNWWNGVSKTLKKMCVKCYALDPITHKKSSFPMWMGPNAIELYKKGMKFQQNIYNKFPQITYHPKRV